MARIAGVAVVGEQGLDHSHGLGGGETAGGGSVLRTGLDVGFDGRLFRDRGGDPGTHRADVSLEPGRPEADLRIRVTQGSDGERIVEESSPMGRPQAFECEVGARGAGLRAEEGIEGFLDCAFVGAGEQAEGFLPDEAVGVGELGEERGRRRVLSGTTARPGRTSLWRRR